MRTAKRVASTSRILYPPHPLTRTMPFPPEIIALIIALGWNEINLTLSERLSLLKGWTLSSKSHANFFRRVSYTNLHFFSARHYQDYTACSTAADKLLCESVTYHIAEYPESRLGANHPMIGIYLSSATHIAPHVRRFGVQWHNWCGNDPSIARLVLPPHIVTLHLMYTHDAAWTRTKYTKSEFWVDRDVLPKAHPNVGYLQLVGTNRELTDAILEACTNRDLVCTHDSYTEMYNIPPNKVDWSW
ncbi:hypothetical protein CYLTODRAFT_476318 [Cylindrobasidium torrendii FP15055 ss-10]|uniref:Uncharacterized protein n=1 Tax=Cylindrobasidium torrendii FP15055 ss-10 TaxID=1314674 RepID=A0A0D7BIH3_9AGAR|nr:hypothetical protein CYLTODRAFT_476318 [Cylindrobasidium torrendii FP15055 ss-10]